MSSRATNLSLTSVGIATLILGGSVVWFGLGSAAAPQRSSEPLSDTPAPPVEQITVHIAGEVVHPGVVTAAVDARVAAIVSLAGGATPDADLTRLNLAATVRDGDHIVVPSAREQTAGGDPAARFDLNTATAEDFETLPGVGPVLAERIVSYRAQHGQFQQLEDLLGVPGIGEAKLAAIRAALDQR